jgi:hypothetical protein
MNTDNDEPLNNFWYSFFKCWNDDDEEEDGDVRFVLDQHAEFIFLLVLAHLSSPL